MMAVVLTLSLPRGSPLTTKIVRQSALSAHSAVKGLMKIMMILVSFVGH